MIRSFPQSLRAAFAIALLLGCAGAYAERDPVPAPENWRRESFRFPLSFAPTIGLEGSEHIRFAPGWGDFASDRAFSYVFLWEVKDIAGPALSVHGLEFALGVYFDGLMRTAAQARRLEAEDVRTVVNFHPMRDVGGWSEAYAGEIHTWNAFAKGEPTRLEVEVTKRSCPGSQAQVFFAVSRARRSLPVWEELRRARQASSCPPV
jgi:hypothetical protein